MSATSAINLDTKNLVAIQQLVPNPVVSTSKKDLEDALLLQMARNKTATEIKNNSVNNKFDLSYNSNDMIPTDILINNSSLETPNVVMTANFHQVEAPVTLDSTQINLDVVHDDVEKEMKILPDTSSYFDSHLKMTVTDNSVFTDSVELWQASFDTSGNNYNFIKALNSHLNTEQNERPLKITEDVSFNTLYALGQNDGKYYTLDANGKVVINDLPTENVLSQNTYAITPNLETNIFNDANMGTYKIKQENDVVNVYITPNTPSTLPIYNADGSGSNVITSLTFNEFQDLFEPNERNKILPQYDFKVTINNTEGSGYSFADSSNTTYFTLDNSNILDNTSYMENLVTQQHSFTITNGSLTVDTSNNGNASNLPYINGLTTNGETLLAPENTTNGQIILNKDTTTTRVDASVNNFSTIRVFNIGEGSVQDGGDTLNDADSNTKYVAYDVQNVLKKSGQGANSYDASFNSAGASMFFIDNGGFVPNNSNVSFQSYIAPVDGEAEFIKIRSNKLLASEDPVVDSNSNFVNNLAGYVYASNVNLPAVNFSEYKLKMEQKTISELQMLDLSANGWSFIMSSDYTDVSFVSSDTYLKSSSAVVNNTYMPVNAIDVIKNNFDVPFKMTYKAVGKSVTIVNQYVDITYNVNGEEQLITVPRNDIRKINKTNPVVVQDLTPTDSFTYNGRTIEIYKSVRTNIFNAKFALPIQPYTNIVAITPEIKSETTYYRAFAVLADGSNVAIPSDAIPSIISAVSNSSYDGRYNATCVLSVANTGSSDELYAEGIIEPKDLKPWKVTMLANGNIQVSDTVDGDVFYGGFTRLELVNSLEVDPSSVEADVLASFTLVAVPDGVTVPEVVLDQPYYTLNLTNDDTPTFAVTNLSLKTTADFNTTSAADSGYLTPVLDIKNNLNVSLITGNKYVALITYEDVPVSGGSADGIYSTAVLTIKDPLTSIIHYQIKISTTIVTDMIIYKNTKDWYRIVKSTGDDAATASSVKRFEQTDYPYYVSNQYTNTMKVDNGVYITTSGNNTKAGDKAEFVLKNVNIAVSLVGPAGTLSEKMETTYTYPGAETLTINRYRNFYGATGNQYYTITRTGTKIEFNMGTTKETYTNVPYNATNTVSQMNLKFTNNYSIFPSVAPSTMNVDVIGDEVIIAIDNPLQDQSGNQSYPTASNPYYEATTLKDWDLYKFSGGIFDIASRRVKLINASYTETSAEYEITLTAASTRVYFINTYIGNPTSIDDASFTQIDDALGYEYSYTYDEIVNDGVVIPGYTFYKSAVLATVPGTYYFVISPPFLKFEMMTDVDAGESHISTLPYVYNNYTENIIFKYLPVVDANSYNPFPTGLLYYNGLNNITFERLASKDFYEYSSNAVNPAYEIDVYGNDILIEEYYGLKAMSSQFIKEHYSDRIDLLVNHTSNTETLNFISDVSQNYVVKLIQSLDNFVGVINTNNVLGNNGDAYNIYVSIGNAFMPLGVYELDLQTGQGTTFAFYDCKTVNYNNKLALLLEKFSTTAPFDYSNLPLNDLRRLSFVITKKEYKYVPLPAIVFGENAYNLADSREALVLANVNGAWTQDMSYNDDFNFNFVALSNQGLRKMLELFATSTTSPVKANYITLKDIMNANSADGCSVFRIKYNGMVVSTFASNGGSIINPIPWLDSNQNSDNEYLAYNVNHFLSTV